MDRAESMDEERKKTPGKRYLAPFIHRKQKKKIIPEKRKEKKSVETKSNHIISRHTRKPFSVFRISYLISSPVKSPEAA
jgi:hypothetical protein